MLTRVYCIVRSVLYINVLIHYITLHSNYLEWPK